MRVLPHDHGIALREDWDTFADSYARLRSPLTPCGDDSLFIQQTISSCAARHPGRPLQSLLLGVTPALAEFRWPPGSFLVAIDRSMEMVRAIWPGNRPASRWAVRANWLALPLRDASCDVVLGDCSLNAELYRNYPSVAANIRAALRAHGVFVLRAFVHPDRKEQPEEVVAGRTRNASFHHFKLRLLMALQPNVEEGVNLGEVHRYWEACGVDHQALATETGWERTEIDTIHRYRGIQSVISFPTRAQLLAQFDGLFSEISSFTPPYPLGERCPTLVLRP